MLVSQRIVESVCGDARLQRMRYLARIDRLADPSVYLLLFGKSLAPSRVNKDPGAVLDVEPAPVAACRGNDERRAV